MLLYVARYLSPIPKALLTVRVFVGQLPLESLPHPVVVHLLPFFKLLGSVMDSCIHQGETFSDSNYWMVNFFVN